MQVRDRTLALLAVLAAAAALAGGVLANSSPAAAPTRPAVLAERTTTGPTPPPSARVSARTQAMQDIQNEQVIAGVPAYIWRDGCAPTSLGMIVGYYDAHGFDALIPGDASLQTTAASQAIASHQVAGGGPEHYEDYALPKDSSAIMADKSELPDGDEHTDDSIADFMHTSRSADGLTYGGSWTNDVGPAFRAYVAAKVPGAIVTTSDLHMGSSLTWAVLTREIDAGRPMVFMVDSSGDGTIDHAVAAIGYRLNTGVQEYACWDTWYSTIRWTPFRGVSSSYSFGVWGATELSLSPGTPDPLPTTSTTPSSSPSPTTTPTTTPTVRPTPSPTPDTTPPVTTVTGADAAWHAAPVMLMFRGDDAQSGVQRTETRVDGAASWSTGDSLLVTGQGTHTVRYRSVDKAGNVETARSCTVKIDVVGPRVSVARATVRRGRTATIVYRITDLTPQATVRIVVTGARGAQARAPRPALRSTGARHTLRFACTLPRGTYRIVVRATDLAGSRQVKPGVARLVVR
jgi:hypothetical protein